MLQTDAHTPAAIEWVNLSVLLILTLAQLNFGSALREKKKHMAAETVPMS